MRVNQSFGTHDVNLAVNKTRVIELGGRAESCPSFEVKMEIKTTNSDSRLILRRKRKRR